MNGMVMTYKVLVHGNLVIHINTTFQVSQLNFIVRTEISRASELNNDIRSGIMLYYSISWCLYELSEGKLRTNKCSGSKLSELGSHDSNCTFSVKINEINAKSRSLKAFKIGESRSLSCTVINRLDFDLERIGQ